MKSTSFRLPSLTVEQLEKLAVKAGMTQTQILVIAIDRMAEKENIK